MQVLPSSFVPSFRRHSLRLADLSLPGGPIRRHLHKETPARREKRWRTTLDACAVSAAFIAAESSATLCVGFPSTDMTTSPDCSRPRAAQPPSLTVSTSTPLMSWSIRVPARSCCASSRTVNSKFSSRYFFISRGDSGDFSSTTATFLGAPFVITLNCTLSPMWYCRMSSLSSSVSSGRLASRACPIPPQGSGPPPSAHSSPRSCRSERALRGIPSFRLR